MIPHEHGAYGQLAFPLVTALAVGRPGVAAAAFVAACVSAFLAHEPLLVLLGQRGGRAARERRTAAIGWLAVWGAIAIVTGIAAFATMPEPARHATVVPIVGAAVLAALIARGGERTTTGELLTAATLASLALPAAAAAYARPFAAHTCAAVFAASFAVVTLSVRAVIAARRLGDAPGARRIAGTSALVAIAALTGLAVNGVISRAGPWAALPSCAVGVWLVTALPSTRHLRTVGWLLVAASASAVVILVPALRAGR